MKIGNEIRRRRKALKWTLEYLANLVDSDTGNLSRIETGKQGAHADMLGRIASALGCSVADLFSETGNEGEAAGVPLGARRIPVLNTAQIAKTGTQPAAGSWVFTEHDLPPGAFAMRLHDESMSPEFRIGDTILVNPSLQPAPGDFVVAVSADHDVMFRKFKAAGLNDAGMSVFELLPLNQDHAGMRSDRVSLSIVGTMVEHRRYWSRFTPL